MRLAQTESCWVLAWRCAFIGCARQKPACSLPTLSQGSSTLTGSPRMPLFRSALYEQQSLG